MTGDSRERCVCAASLPELRGQRQVWEQLLRWLWALRLGSNIFIVAGRSIPPLASTPSNVADRPIRHESWTAELQRLGLHSNPDYVVAGVDAQKCARCQKVNLPSDHYCVNCGALLTNQGDDPASPTLPW